MMTTPMMKPRLNDILPGAGAASDPAALEQALVAREKKPVDPAAREKAAKEALKRQLLQERQASEQFQEERMNDGK